MKQLKRPRPPGSPHPNPLPEGEGATAHPGNPRPAGKGGSAVFLPLSRAGVKGGREREPGGEAPARHTTTLSLLLVLLPALAAAEISPCLQQLTATPETPIAGLASRLLDNAAGGDVETLSRQLLAAGRAAGDHFAEACAYEQLGNAAFYRGEVETAVVAFRASLKRLEALGDLEHQAYRLKDLGVCFRSLGRFAEALAAFEEARRRYGVAFEGPFAISYLGNLGSLYARLGFRRLAVAAYDEALALAKSEVPPSQAWDLQIRLGLLYYASDAPHRAVALLEQAVDGAEHHAGDREVSWVLGELGWAYKATGDLESARAAARASLQRARQSGDHLNLVGSFIDLGHFNADSDPVAAEASFLDAATRAEGAAEPLAWQAHAGLGALRRRQGRRDEAITLFERSIELAERQRRDLKAWQDRSTLASWNRSVYGSLAATLLERGGAGDAERAFTAAEQGKARALDDALAAAGVSPGDSSRRAAVEARIDTLVAELQGNLDPAATAQRLRHLEAARAGLDEVLSGLVRIRDAQPIGTDAARSLLPPRTALLAYLTSGAGLSAFVLRPERFSARSLEVDVNDLALSIEVYLSRLSGGGRDWMAASRRLYRQLVQPLAAELEGADNVVVVADGPLRSLPFATLMDPAAASAREGLWLAHTALSTVPSAAVLAGLMGRRSQAEAPAELLVLADPRLDSDFPLQRRQFELYRSDGPALLPLPGSRREAREVSSFAAGSVVLVGPEATEDALTASRPERFGALHFATHAIVDPLTPRRSALLLSATAGDDGFLQAREIARLDLSAHLVVLAACRSARDQATGGGGVHGLALSFFHAGAASVAASLWAVDDRVTTEVMGTFYRGLAAGLGKAEALRRAQLELLERYGLEAPQHWGPWLLLGEPFGTVPLSGRGPGWRLSPPPPAAAGALGLGLVLAAISWRRRRPL